MSRALLYAGAASVIANLWDVADAPSAGLVADFYRRSLRGADKRSALRGAQLEMLESFRAGRVAVRSRGGRVRLAENPFFWAGSILLGEP